jgi:ribosome-associated heat shock protein Hsp15
MSDATIRLDKFLFHARLARTRSLAARLCTGGKVAVGGALALKPHHPVRVSDFLTIERGGWQRRLAVRALPRRRGGAAEALLCYDEIGKPVLIPAEAWVPLLDEEISETVPESV